MNRRRASAASFGKVRSGSILGIVLIFLLIAFVLGVALINRAIRGSRTGGWSRDHLALRLIAESTAEELFLRLSLAANQPETEVHGQLRRIPAEKDPAGREIGGLSPTAITQDLARLESSLGAPVEIVSKVTLHDLTPVSLDPLERCGRVRFEVTARLRRQGEELIERVRVDRAFRCARITPPRPLDQLGVFIALASPGPLEKFPPGSPVHARARGDYHTLLSLLTEATEEGFRRVPARLEKDVKGAMDLLSPESLQSRAHYLVRSSEELRSFIGERVARGLPLDGILHCAGAETVSLRFPRFRGRCLISVMGQLKVGDIALADKDRDRLTLVSMKRIVVEGRQIEASLVNVTDVQEGVVFGNRASIRGSLLTTRFPAGVNLSGQELGDCQIQYDPLIDSGESPDNAPDGKLLSHYIVAFASHPISTEHRRDVADWSDW